ncbi:unnamed protein product [Timema podura]|uniref:Uncharacterized protein n=2 Tax=Timema TaxID=61471 RepID=A0A7R9PRD4_TIMGE|nr:unnamed protein product [Timema genevievae]CAG2062480.1 unnamed protein product [Timema podura]
MMTNGTKPNLEELRESRRSSSKMMVFLCISKVAY